VDVVVDSKIIGDRPEGVHQSDRGIQTVRGIRSTHSRERIRQAVLGIAVLKAKIKVGRLRTLSAPSRPTTASSAETSSSRRALTESALAERMIQPNVRSEEHTSELQSRGHLVCRLLLEKKK